MTQLDGGVEGEKSGQTTKSERFSRAEHVLAKTMASAIARRSQPHTQYELFNDQECMDALSLYMARIATTRTTVMPEESIFDEMLMVMSSLPAASGRKRSEWNPR